MTPADIQAACFQIVRALNDAYGADMVGGSFGIHAADGTSLTITEGEPFTVTWRWSTGSATGERAERNRVKIDVTVIDPDDYFDAESREFGEPENGPWLRVTCESPFLDYKVCVGCEDGNEALGRRINALVAEALQPIGGPTA